MHCRFYPTNGLQFHSIIFFIKLSLCLSAPTGTNFVRPRDSISSMGVKWLMLRTNLKC